MDRRTILSEKKRIIIKVGTTTITYSDTGNINLDKLEKFVRILINLRNQGKEIVVVSSGAVGVGRKALGISHKPQDISEKQAYAAIGQARLMMIYEKLFNEYSQLTAQVLLTRESFESEDCRKIARCTFDELFRLGVVPIVNENDVVSIDELAYGNFGDNDTLAANVTALVEGDLLILMSDIEGLYTDDPKRNENARFIHVVSEINAELEQMAKGASTEHGTGGMETKIQAAKIAINAGADMIIANGDNIYTINDIMAGKKVGTLFLNEDHAVGVQNEIAPERPKYRRQAKRMRKENIRRVMDFQE